MRSLREIALDYLARREHSCRELTTKLLAKGFTPDEVASTLDRLVQQGLQSDARFVENYINYRQQAGFGPHAIRRELQQKGIATDLIEEFLSRDFTWYALMQQVWQKKFSGKLATDHPKEYARQVRFLLQRGFELEMIRELLCSG